MKARPRSVAVVGAGLAGLAAARHLVEQSFEVRVFERARGVGGRSAHRDRDGHAFDHGAQYFTVRDPRFATQVQAWIEAGVVAPWSGRVVAFCDGEAPRLNASTVRYVGLPGMNAMAGHLARDLGVRTGCVVERLERTTDGWCIAVDDGESVGPFDAVVLAMPPEQATRIVAREWLPEIPEAAASHPCWCALAAFEAPLGVDFDAAFVNGTVLDWVARDSSKPGRPPGERWVVHAGPAWSAGRLQEPAAEIARTLLAHLFDALDIPARPCLHLAGHRWSLARPAHELQVECLWQAEHAIALAGDWCNGGRVEGAYLSGLAAAGKVAGAGLLTRG